MLENFFNNFLFSMSDGYSRFSNYILKRLSPESSFTKDTIDHLKSIKDDRTFVYVFIRGNSFDYAILNYILLKNNLPLSQTTNFPCVLFFQRLRIFFQSLFVYWFNITLNPTRFLNDPKIVKAVKKGRAVAISLEVKNIISKKIFYPQNIWSELVRCVEEDSKKFL